MNACASSQAPSYLRPLTKKVGVPLTPLRTPLMKSSPTRWACVWSLNSRSKRARSRPMPFAVLPKMLVIERLLMLEEGVVHLPEAPLSGAGFRSLGRVLRVRVNGLERKVAEDKTKIRAELALDHLQNRMGAAAMRTLEVPVLHEGESRGG